ncbi:MAG: hypothetical protein ACYSUX_06025 [Planctomycetota bacterium]|jgi:hypothetical protein
MRKKMTINATLLAFVMVLLGVPIQAQERTSHVDGWEFVVAPYLWMAGIDGDVTVKGTKSSVDARFSDIVDNLDVGALGYFQIRKDKWGAYFDVMYLRVVSDEKVGPVDLKVRSDTTLAGAGVLYRVYEGFAGAEGNPVATDIYVGGRYVNLDLELDFVGVTKISGSKDWVDPLIGVTYSRDLSKKFLIKTTADIGGFGIASDLTWSASILGGYRLGRTANLWFGYRYLDIDYTKGSGADKFAYDAAMHGPILGASFHF